MSKVVVVTGASAGLGRAAALAFARRGAKVALVARGRDRLESAAKVVREAGGEALPLRGDVADAERIEAIAGEVEERFGAIDVWVNNAMVSVFSPVKEMQADEYRRVTEVTYLGYVHGTLAALRRMLPRDRGVIIQVGSALAYRGIPLQSAYCAAKHAIQGFMDSLRGELIHDKSQVRVTMIQMSALNTPQFGWVKSRLPRKAQPVPPIFAPEVGGEAVVWASEHDRREIYLGMSSVTAIVGDKIAPGFVDRYLAKNGYDGQQHDGPDDSKRPHNLWKAPAGDPGAAGGFGDVAVTSSPHFWMVKNRRWVAMTAAVAAVALGKGREHGARQIERKRRERFVRFEL